MKQQINTGYKIKKQENDDWTSSSSIEIKKPYVISKTGNAYGMWIASSSASSGDCVMALDYKGVISSVNIDFSNGMKWMGFRPIVCLKSEIQLQKNEDGNYEIVNQQ